MSSAFASWLEPSPENERGLPWALRQLAWVGVRKHGFPVLKTEAWKYTSLRALERLTPRLSTPDAAHSLASASAILNSVHAQALPASRLIFIDGVLQSSLSSYAGFELLPANPDQAQELLQTLGGAEDGFVRLALAHSTAVWRLVQTAETPESLAIIHIHTGNLALHQVYLQLELGPSQELDLMEYFYGASGQRGEALYNYCLEARIGAAARLRHGRHLSPLVDTLKFSRSEIYLQAGAEYCLGDVLYSEASLRHEARIRYLGAQGRASLNSAAQLSGRARLDQDWLMIHQAASCHTEQIFRAAVDDHSSASYTGRAHIPHGVKGSVVHQSSRGLMLSNESEINARPVLEIYADEVQASHGATVGCLDEAALHYLCARGINHSVARMMLIDAFVGSAMADFPESALKDELIRCLKADAGGQHEAALSVSD